MPAEPEAKLTFLPWVRSGAATAIAAPETLGPQPAVAEVRITLAVNGTSLPEKALQLRGPADVLGIDVHQVVRTDPLPGATAFESNCFASIEFDRPDFPWLFTPARATSEGRLRPWLRLVVVREQPGVTLASSGDAPLPVLRVESPARSTIELPDPAASWAWAHAQVAADGGSDPNALRAALEGAPELSLSRLVCPRFLSPDTSYLACVVPAFELGRMAGRGIPIRDEDLASPTALRPAWTLDTDQTVELPVYYSWRFHTGAGGDFATLARRLHASIPSGIGRRTVDLSQVARQFEIDFTKPVTIEVGGALRSASPPASGADWSGSIAQVFEKALAQILNRPELDRTNFSQARPLLAPPLYGRWHAARGLAKLGAANWFDRLNLDPHWRIAAALGTRVVQQHQEALMASAWEQAADAQQVNRRLHQLQMSRAVGESLYARHLLRFSDELTMRAASPAFSRLRIASSESPVGRTLTALMTRSALPVQATSTAMRRIGRQRGPLGRRTSAQGAPRSADQTWVRRLNLAFDPGIIFSVHIDQAVAPALPVASDVANAPYRSDFRLSPDGEPLAPPPAADPLPANWDYPGFFRAAATEHLSRLQSDVSVALELREPMDEAVTLATVRQKMEPAAALAKLAGALLTIRDTALPPTAAGVTPAGLETVMTAPEFPQPMYEPLKELSQDLLLPGLDKIPPDSVCALQTDRMFVEAYLVGLNFEMARELLWRGFPTDQQGTYFKRFWQYDTDERHDLEDLRAKPDRALGGAIDDAPDQFVMVLRSVLLQRYPNALVYLTPALSDASAEAPADVFPIFSGRLDPDVSFFGFPVSPSAAIGTAESPGYFVVIEEHPTEPRFGVDVVPEGVSHLAVSALSPAPQQAAQVAALTRRRPIRIAIHASRLVRQPAGPGVPA